MMRSMAERVRWINDVAEEDLDRAQGMLDMFNEMYGTNCGFLARRVVYSSAPIENVAEFYANCHDLLAVLTIG